MHSYLRAVGFSKCKTTADVNKIIEYVLQNYDIRRNLEDEEAYFGLIEKGFGESFGLHVFGEYTEDGDFLVDYYYPYFQSYEITTQELPTLEKHAAKESYAGVCEDLKVGVSLIFYLQNIMDYKAAFRSEYKKIIDGVVLTGLSLGGTVLLPISKNEKQKKQSQETTNNRMNLIAAAREGDQSAMESLTLDDIDTYSMVSRRIMTEDVFSIVESYFMPYGIECDHYSVMGDIIDCHLEKNHYTDEEVWVLTLNCNDLIFDVCINKEDILGEPVVGRRFKGNIWLQGQIRYYEE